MSFCLKFLSLWWHDINHTFWFYSSNVNKLKSSKQQTRKFKTTSLLVGFLEQDRQDPCQLVDANAHLQANRVSDVWSERREGHLLLWPNLVRRYCCSHLCMDHSQNCSILTYLHTTSNNPHHQHTNRNIKTHFYTYIRIKLILNFTQCLVLLLRL